MQVLRDTSRLRFHRAEYVRRLAAQSVGFLLRQAPRAGLAGALRVALRQQALAPTAERTQVRIGMQHTQRHFLYKTRFEVLSVPKSARISFAIIKRTPLHLQMGGDNPDHCA